MEEIVAMFPVLPGKSEALIAFAETISGPRAQEFSDSQTTVQTESWYLQKTPMGDFCLVHFSAPSIINVFAGLATADDDFCTWYRAQIQDITGIDLANPPSTLPQCIFNWRRETV